MTVLENLYRNIARKSQLDADRDTMAAAAAEIERLREALETIASGDIVICKPLQMFARAILKAGPAQKTA